MRAVWGCPCPWEHHLGGVPVPIKGHPGVSLSQKGHLGGVPVPRSVSVPRRVAQGCPGPQEHHLGVSLSPGASPRGVLDLGGLSGVCPCPRGWFGCEGTRTGEGVRTPTHAFALQELSGFTLDQVAFEDGKGKCPYDPTKGHTGLIVGRWHRRAPAGVGGSPLRPPSPALSPCLADGELYSATFNNFLGTEPVILRNLGPHYSMKTEYLTSWLNGRVGGTRGGGTARAPSAQAWRYPPPPPPPQSPTSWLRLTCRRARPAAPGMTTRFTSSSASGRWSTTATRSRWWPAWRGSARYGEGTTRAGDAVPARLRSTGERGDHVLTPGWVSRGTSAVPARCRRSGRPS